MNSIKITWDIEVLAGGHFDIEITGSQVMYFRITVLKRVN